jgi:hypothetical protein
MKSRHPLYLATLLLATGLFSASGCANESVFGAPSARTGDNDFVAKEETRSVAHPEQESAPKPITGKALRQLVTGNTIVGTVFIGSNGRHYFPDNRFKEYHAADGRILGFAVGDSKEMIKNENTCWRIQNDNTVCYYNYSDRQGHCSQYFTTGKPGEIRGIATDTPDVFMVGTVEKGNPHTLTDYGVKWTCQK